MRHLFISQHLLSTLIIYKSLYSYGNHYTDIFSYNSTHMGSSMGTRGGPLLLIHLILKEINAETSDLNPRVMCTSKSSKPKSVCRERHWCSHVKM